MGLPVTKIESNTSLTFPIRFHVPGLLPNLDLKDLIKSDYYLRLLIGFERASRKHPIIDLEVNILNKSIYRVI